MKHKTEKKIETHVAAFVATLNGRFRKHCSDAMLVGVLMQRLTREPYRGGHSNRVMAMIGGDPNAAYDAAQSIFEGIIERHCGAGGNGHHVAQDFGVYMDAALASDNSLD